VYASNQPSFALAGFISLYWALIVILWFCVLWITFWIHPTLKSIMASASTSIGLGLCLFGYVTSM